MEKEAKDIERALAESDRLFLKAKQGRIYHTMLAQLDRHLIQNTLRITFGNQIKASRLLGINRNTLHSKIKKLGINPRAYKD